MAPIVARVSVGLPVYRGARYLQSAVESLQAQTLTDFEVLIADNASDDETGDLAMSVCADDQRFRYHRHARNLGAAANFNFTFCETTAPFFRWHSHDDVIAPTFLERCVEALDNQPEAVLAFPQTLRIDESGEPLSVYLDATRRGRGSPSARIGALIGPGDPRSSLLHMCFPVFGLIRRETLAATSLILNMPRSDQVLLVELAAAGDFVEIEEPLLLRREHPHGSVISAERARTGADVERQLAAWFDPSRGRRFPATNTRCAIAFAAATLRTPMSYLEHVRSLSVALGWAARHGRTIGGELKIVARELGPRAGAGLNTPNSS